MPDQQHMRDFFKRRVLSKVGDLIATVDQLGLRDLADFGVADGLPSQAARIFGFLGGFYFGRAGHGHLSKETVIETNVRLIQPARTPIACPPPTENLW